MTLTSIIGKSSAPMLATFFFPIGRRPWLFALLCVVVIAFGARAQQRGQDGLVLNEEFLDQQVFRQVANRGDRRQRLDRELQIRIDDIDRVCKLTAAQKEKLHLMGRGDIKRFFDDYELFRQKFGEINLKTTDAGWEEKWQMVIPELSYFQQSFRAMFGADSLFQKSLSNTLSAKQRMLYRPGDRSQMQFRQGHGAVIEIEVDGLVEERLLRRDEVGLRLREEFLRLEAPGFEPEEMKEPKAIRNFDGIQWERPGPTLPGRGRVERPETHSLKWHQHEDGPGRTTKPDVG